MKNERDARISECLTIDSPVRHLVDNLDGATVDALIACCDQYMNAEMRQAAQKVALSGGRIYKTIQEVSTKALQVSAGTGSRGRWQSIQRSLLRELQRRGGSLPAERTESLVLAWFVAIECDLKGVGTRKAASDVLPHISAKHDRTSLLLGQGYWFDNLTRMLQACDGLARALAAQMPAMSEWHWFKAFLLLHGANVQDVLMAHEHLGFVLDDEDRVYQCADRAIGIETEMLEMSNSPFPLAYREPFGARDWDEHGFTARSGFAARVALAALATSTRMRAAASDGDLSPEPMISLLRHLWQNDAPHEQSLGRKGAEFLQRAFGSAHPRSFVGTRSKRASEELAALRKELEADTGRESVAVRACQAVEEIARTSEYQVSGEWRRSGGHNGAFARAISDRNAITIADRDLLRRAVDRLATDDDGRFSETVVVALAGKLAALEHKIWEPIPKYPKWPGKSHHNGASYQIEVIRHLAQKLRAPAESVLLGMAQGIYFTKNLQMHDGFDWSPQAIAWRSLTSTSHIEGESKPGPWLWLYGRHFQEFVDRTIKRVAAGEPGTAQAGNWDRLLRFLFLVPMCKSSGFKVRLADHAAANDDLLRLALRMLCATGRGIEGVPFDMPRDLWMPATENNHHVGPGNALFGENMN